MLHRSHVLPRGRTHQRSSMAIRFGMAIAYAPSQKTDLLRAEYDIQACVDACKNIFALQELYRFE